ncbi:breast carcinoma-amplified sequence 4 isoform X3 [Aotus nancymaae]|uniref:breast carcinoma-amplified sequence 4 isoform X3 n=1 Tax=Aotus nancymaae TaxID=37293 RepID=UPI0030FF21B8
MWLLVSRRVNQKLRGVSRPRTGSHRALLPSYPIGPSKSQASPDSAVGRSGSRVFTGGAARSFCKSSVGWEGVGGPSLKRDAGLGSCTVVPSHQQCVSFRFLRILTALISFRVCDCSHPCEGGGGDHRGHAPQAGGVLQPDPPVSLSVPQTGVFKQFSCLSPIRSDTSQILEEHIPVLKAKLTEMRGIYAKVDRLEKSPAPVPLTYELPALYRTEDYFPVDAREAQHRPRTCPPPL